MRRRIFALTAAALLSASSQAIADDSLARTDSAALAGPGLVLLRSADIRMTDEDLKISPKSVHVHFVFANESGKDIDATVAFVLPDVDMVRFTKFGSVDAPVVPPDPLGTVTSDPLNFVGFRILANGTPIAPAVEQRAFLGTRDVTALVKAAGLPLNPLAPNADFDDAFFKLPEATQKQVVAEGLVRNFGDPHYATWTLRTRFYWPQHFPAGGTVTFDQDYEPVSGGDSAFNPAVLRDRFAGDYAKNYCIDASARAALAKMSAKGFLGRLSAATTDYILTTGNNWKGPIGRFHLTIDTTAPGNFLSLCWPKSLRQTGPATYEFSATDFAPDQDIKMLVVGMKPSG